MLRIRLLGELSVESGGKPVELTGSWRTRSLLAWLALNPGGHRRGDLAARFWPDVLDSSARASLRNGLWALRRALGEEAGALAADRERVELLGAPAVWTDAAAFAAHLEAGELDAALALCRGELLAGLEEEWVHEYRDAHRERLSGLLERLAARAEAAGDPGSAVAWARRRAGLDPLAEPAQRALIERLARAGDRAGALAAYGHLRERYRRELGISPAPETRALVERLREGAVPGAPAAAAGSGAAPEPGPGGPGERLAGGASPGRAEPAGWSPGRPFPLPPRLRRTPPSALVGREAELAALRGLWAEAGAGGGARLALVVGEAGIGKSRLAAELAVEAAAGGAIVLHGGADEELLLPHQHVVEALAHYLGVASADELAARVDRRAADLAPVAPVLAWDGRGGPDGGPSAGTGGESESRRYRLFEAVAGLLAELAEAAPVLLVLDDLHWADESTAALLQHLLESRPQARLLVLGTQRPGDSGRDSALAATVQRLTQAELVERLPLAGLAEAAVGELSAGLAARALAPEMVRAIAAETGGNPFFVRETVRHLEERQGADLLALSGAEVPQGVREVVDLRLARLGEGCARLLVVAAVIGTRFEFGLLEAVSDLEGEDLLGALDEALAAEFIVEAGGGEEAFAFSHALLRRAVLARPVPPQRRRIHARVAAALEEARGKAALLEVAHHLYEAVPVCDREQALDYATRAASRATEQLAYAEAVEWFTRARSLLPPGDPRRRTLALKRAVVYQGLFHALMDGEAPAAAEPG
jgi:DNA-binding SARP family transcriptional activator